LRLLTVIGTRPEAIKLAPVLKQLKQIGADAEIYVCVTGQHREMLDQMLTLFGIVPDIDLNIMRPAQNPSQTASLVLQKLDPVLADLEPDWILVQGDTTTVMASSIAAHHRRARVAHVEAGLRSFDRANPFPEEMNRVIADHVSDLHFAPTRRARNNLLLEGIKERSIFVTGNTVIDALLEIMGYASRIDLEQASFPDAKSLILVTAHRRENHGKPLEEICSALEEIADRSDVHIVYTVHKNPDVWQPVNELLGGKTNITLLPPVEYPAMIALMKRSKLILTDSGGIQEEAPTLGVPVLVLRQVTERPEALEAGAAILVGTEKRRIVREVNRLLDDQESYDTMAKARNPYGDGRAGERIAGIILAGGNLPAGMDEWT
jgi:UDP-N-acetylglucosamine 2-epimerase (non-hydrolysing)